MKVLCSLLENTVKVYKYNKGAITLTVSQKIRHRKKHIMIKYHHFQSFVANGDVEIKHVDTKEQIADIFTKPLDSELFGYLHYNLNGW